MVQRQALDLVQGYQHFYKELLVFRFQWQSETVNYRAQNLQEFPDTVEVFRFVNEPKNTPTTNYANKQKKTPEKLT